MNVSSVLAEARQEPTLRPFVVAFERQSQKLEASFAVLRDAGEITIQIDREWMDQLEQSCRNSTSTAMPAPCGTRC